MGIRYEGQETGGVIARTQLAKTVNDEDRIWRVYAPERSCGGRTRSEESTDYVQCSMYHIVRAVPKNLLCTHILCKYIL